MSRDLFTVNEDDPIDLVPNIMHWRGIRHVLVENDGGELVGLVTSSRLVGYFATRLGAKTVGGFVRDIMATDLITVSVETTTNDAISLMRKHEIGCLPVCQEDKLVGIVTERDFVNVADHFLREYLESKNKK